MIADVISGGWGDSTRPRSPSPGRGGRFDDGGRRSPPPFNDRWSSAHPDRPNNGQAPYRNRSPDFGRKRRRDESPPNSRDRYIPNYEHRVGHGARYGPGPDAFDDMYRNSSGGGGGHWDDRYSNSPTNDRSMGSARPLRTNMPPPSELPHLVTFRYFAEFMRATSPHIADDKDKLAEQWRRYRQDHSQKQLVTFFEGNKTQPWFREKYQPGPEFEELRARLKKKGREGRVAKFVEGLQKGDFDIVNYDYLPMSKKFSTSKPSGAEVDVNAPNGTSTIKADPSDSPSLNTPTLADGATEDNKLDASGSQTLEEKPSVAKLEENESGKDDHTIHLEPNEMDDHEDPDFDYSTKMAEMLGPSNGMPGSSSALGSLIGESMRGKGGSDDIVVLPPSANQLFIKSISPDISREELENHCKQAEGFDYLALSDPHTGKKLHRVGWVSFVPGTDMKAAEDKLSESKINNFTLHMMRAERPAYQKLRVTPGIMNTSTRIKKDLLQARKLATLFEQDYYTTGAGNEEEQRGSAAIEERIKSIFELAGVQEGDADAKNAESSDQKPSMDAGDEIVEATGIPVPHSPDQKPDLTDEQHSLKMEKKTLDLYLYYLRTVFNSCYYCACVCDFQEELLRRCAKHVRKPPPARSDSAVPASGNKRNANPPPKANESSWARTLDDRLQLLLDASEVDPRDFGGEKIDDEIHRLCQPQITDEGAGKFRCKNCSKLFKAMNFIEKHIMSKHGEVINQDSIERIKYLNNYILDPSHTTPQPPTPPEHSQNRSHNNNGLGGPGTGNSGPNGMMNMGGGGGGPADFHPMAPGGGGNGYGPMVGGPMMGPPGAMGPMGGPYGGYPQAMFNPYGNYPGMPPAMFASGSMMGPGGAYYMNPGYPYAPPVYPSMPHQQQMMQSRMGSGGNQSRRLGERISKQFAGGGDGIGEDGMPSNHKRSKKENGGGSGNDPTTMMMIASDPRSKTVLAYNDLDVTAGEEIVLNY